MELYQQDAKVQKVMQTASTTLHDGCIKSHLRAKFDLRQGIIRTYDSN